MKLIPNYEHRVASHCETGSLRNMLEHAGLSISEPMIFGLGSGPAFYYLFFAKGPSTFPLIGIRNPPGNIVKNVSKLCGIDMFARCLPSTSEALETANRLIDSGTPVAASVDMFYMKYLPGFLHVHAPFHFILIVGRDGDGYAISDPYSEHVASLARMDLATAWETHARFGKDNFLAYVKAVPKHVEWKASILVAIRRTCKAMLLPPLVRNAFFFVGIEGMRTYARKLLEWPKRYRGVVLREGILFNAVGFEDQGTGGAAFRLMYGAFLQEAAEILGSAEMRRLAERMIEHGQQWRLMSSRIISVGKEVPVREEKYDEWYSRNASRMEAGLREIHDLMLERARVEQHLFEDLRAEAARH